jgi:hypothetical protein
MRRPPLTPKSLTTKKSVWNTVIPSFTLCSCWRRSMLWWLWPIGLSKYLIRFQSSAPCWPRLVPQKIGHPEFCPLLAKIGPPEFCPLLAKISPPEDWSPRVLPPAGIDWSPRVLPPAGQDWSPVFFNPYTQGTQHHPVIPPTWDYCRPSCSQSHPGGNDP